MSSSIETSVSIMSSSTGVRQRRSGSNVLSFSIAVSTTSMSVFTLRKAFAASCKAGRCSAFIVPFPR
jgi:hypothetical protein